jgi:hypothetical protein
VTKTSARIVQVMGNAVLVKSVSKSNAVQVAEKTRTVLQARPVTQRRFLAVVEKIATVPLA